MMYSQTSVQKDTRYKGEKMERQKIIYFRNSGTHVKMSVERAKQFGRPFYFYDPEAGLCAPTEEGHEPVVGHKGRDYTKSNPLTPDKNKEATTVDWRMKNRIVPEESNASSKDYTKNNPLTPEKKTTIRKSPLAP